MKILIVGKYPPVQGGVSARTYRFARALAARGHTVDVVTNANEVSPPFRMMMRDEDWEKCSGAIGDGELRVHWTDPPDASQFHIPVNSATVSKIASLGIEAATAAGCDVVFSFYMEPYAVAGHLIAQATGLPHVIRTAGSDAGRLWDHPQFTALYDHVFRSGTLLSPGYAVARKLRKLGISPDRIRIMPSYTIDTEMFAPTGDALDVEEILSLAAADPAFAPFASGKFRDDIPYMGIYSKLGPFKGTEQLLHAVALLRDRGCDVGLLAMSQGRHSVGTQFRETVAELNLSDRVVQLPFLPNWRVPEFIRRCLAVCSLEQDFPITFHAPILVREVMACGVPLVASTEVLEKAPYADTLVHGYNCIAVDDVKDIVGLADRLEAIVRRPDLAAPLGDRARHTVLAYQKNRPFPHELEQILAEAVARVRRPSESVVPAPPAVDKPSTLSGAATPRPANLYRLQCRGWALSEDELTELIPRPIHAFETKRVAAGAAATAGSVAAGSDGEEELNTLAVDATTVAVVEMCDGRRTVGEIATLLKKRTGASDATNEPGTVVERVLKLLEAGFLTVSKP